MLFNSTALRKQFPILKRKINGTPLVYLDNASTTQKPEDVLKVMDRYYRTGNANVHRGIHTLSEEATEAYEKSRATIARFIGALPEELIFTRNATESINILAQSLGNRLQTDDEVVVSQMEHHSNLVPWQQACKRTGAQLKIIPITDEGRLDLDHLDRSIGTKTKIVSLTHCSNVLGTQNMLSSVVRTAHNVGAIVIVDGAQSVGHTSVNVKAIECDFYAFSGHKMYGPMGIGALYGRKELLATMDPVLFGGDMIKTVEWFDATWNDIPWKFEAGTPNVAGALGLATAVEWMQSIGMDTLEREERVLTEHLLKTLKDIPGLTIHGPTNTTSRIGVVSFSMSGIHPHDIATIANEHGVAIRSGHHCAMPLMVRLGLPATARASLAAYNTKKEIDTLGTSLEHVLRVFQPKVNVNIVEAKKNLWQQ